MGEFQIRQSDLRDTKRITNILANNSTSGLAQNNVRQWTLGSLRLTLCTKEDLSAEVAAFRAHTFRYVYESGQFADWRTL
jgi:hypothetical protein